MHTQNHRLLERMHARRHTRRHAGRNARTQASTQARKDELLLLYREWLTTALATSKYKGNEFGVVYPTPGHSTPHLRTRVLQVKRVLVVQRKRVLVMINFSRRRRRHHRRRRRRRRRRRDEFPTIPAGKNAPSLARETLAANARCCCGGASPERGVRGWLWSRG